jgi:hypothetical protein
MAVAESLNPRKLLGLLSHTEEVNCEEGVTPARARWMRKTFNR